MIYRQFSSLSLPFSYSSFPYFFIKKVKLILLKKDNNLNLQKTDLEFDLWKIGSKKGSIV